VHIEGCYDRDLREALLDIFGDEFRLKGVQLRRGEPLFTVKDKTRIDPRSVLRRRVKVKG
jgi:hypothetical protein